MDYLRSGYKGIIKPYAMSDDTIAIRWYRAAPGAKEFPLPTAFVSSVWEDDRYSHTVVGEVLRTREWRSTKLPGGAPPGQEFHGDPDWWLHGIPAAHRHDTPPNCYSPDWCLLLEQGGELLLESLTGCIQVEHPQS
jgi:hypothetical protein